MSGIKCSRCGNRAESVNNEASTTYWGAVKAKTTTTVERRVRILGRDWNYRTHALFTVDEERPLCVECWTAFVAWVGANS